MPADGELRCDRCGRSHEPGGACRGKRAGTVVAGRYAIVRLLGFGGMGEVYEARHTQLPRRFAVKFLLPELAARGDSLRRFQTEIEAAARLEHPNIAAVTDAGIADDGAPYFVMEYLEGTSAARLLDRGPLTARRAAGMVVQACHALAAAHEQGIVHRDLKPDNLFVCRSGDGGDLVKVLDFGIAKLVDDSTSGTKTGAAMGTAQYMSPEQARGERSIDARTDVYSLGVVLYELLAARRPFAGDSFLSVLHEVMKGRFPPLDQLRPDLPPDLVAAVHRAMAFEPDARFPSMRRFARELRDLAADGPPSTALRGHAGVSPAPEPARAASDLPTMPTSAPPADAPSGPPTSPSSPGGLQATVPAARGRRAQGRPGRAASVASVAVITVVTLVAAASLGRSAWRAASPARAPGDLAPPPPASAEEPPPPDDVPAPSATASAAGEAPPAPSASAAPSPVDARRAPPAPTATPSPLATGRGSSSADPPPNEPPPRRRLAPVTIDPVNPY